MSEKRDIAELRSAIEGATVLGIRFSKDHTPGESPGGVLLMLRLPDGRPFTLDIWCELSAEAAEAHGQALYPLAWGKFDPGLVYQACLFTDADRTGAGEDDPLAEASAPVWPNSNP